MKAKLLVQVLILPVMVTIFSACSKEDDPEPGNETPAPSKVEFLKVNDTLDLTDDSLVVQLKFDRLASVDGHISVRFTGDAVHGLDFTTRPQSTNGIITLALLKEAPMVEFTVFRTGPLQAERTLNLVLENPTEGFELGTRHESTVMLKKHPDQDVTVDFAEEMINITESVSDGFEIILNLIGSLLHTENVLIEVTSSQDFIYGTHFLTDPVAVQNELILDAIPGADTVSFKIIPVDDNLVLGSYEVMFSLHSTTGQLKKGTNTEFVVRIEEDDNNQVEVHTIAELRNMFNEFEGEFWLGLDYFIEGVITSGSNVANNKTAYIQDNTGGIMLMFTVQNYLKLGDKVRINLEGGTGTTINDQKAIIDIHDMLGIKLAQNQVVIPEVVTPEQVGSGEYEGMRVRIDDAYFPEADGTNVFAGSWVIKQGDSSAAVATYQWAPFSNYVLPEGNVSVIGIVGDWGRIMPQVYSHDIIR